MLLNDMTLEGNVNELPKCNKVIQTVLIKAMPLYRKSAPNVILPIKIRSNLDPYI